MVYKKWYTCDLRLQLKKLIDSKLKKHGRDVIKQSVIFAPENKVSCLKQGSNMNKLFFQTRKVGLCFCMRNFSSNYCLACNIVTYTATKNELNIFSLSCMGTVHNNWLSSPRAMDDLYPVSNVLIPKISLPIQNLFFKEIREMSHYNPAS